MCTQQADRSRTFARSTHPNDGVTLWTPDFVRLIAASAAYGFSFSCFILLPKHLVTELQASPADLGMVSGAFGVAAVLSAFAVGSWIDRCRRRDLLAAAAALNVATGVLFVFADTVGPYLLALRFVQGGSFALAFSAAPTLAATLAPSRHLGKAVGIAGASMLATNAVATAVGEAMDGALGWDALCVLSALAAAVSLYLVRGVDEARPGSGAAVVGGFLSVARRPEARRAATVVVLSGTGFGSLFTFLGPYALELGRADISGFFACYAFVATAVRLGFGGLGDRFGHGRTAVAALTLYAGVVASVIDFDPRRMEITGALLGLAHGVFHPTMIARLMSRALPSERGRLMAVFAGAFNSGCWIGALGLGIIADAAGYRSAFAVAAAAVCLGLAVLVADEHSRTAEHLDRKLSMAVRP